MIRLADHDPASVVGAAGFDGEPLRWTVAQDCPTSWQRSLVRCGGGFFHSPLGLAAGAPEGEPVFAELRLGDDVVGIAAGVRSRCRLSQRARHVYLPTLPAILSKTARQGALAALVDALRAERVAEVTLDSFDALWQIGAPNQPTALLSRQEHEVVLEPSGAALWGRLAAGHRRQVRRGDRAGWRLDLIWGTQARDLLGTVQDLASSRAAARGDGFRAQLPRLVAEASSPTDRHAWGAATFTVWREATPLAAALVGWANGRAFYVLGGSTAAGYEAGAGIWLHWRIICRLCEEGFTAYNLGGTPPSAQSPSDPAHGLYRFKLGFGARLVPCRGARWVLSAAHARVHRLGHWFGARLG
ncbi:MAG: GNAT family N-acetyltransferase [Gemmatimonadetes bacterium]|nr:GNAT family N-acetyltransferase [Gemmatimonadota bacterium]